MSKEITTITPTDEATRELARQEPVDVIASNDGTLWVFECVTQEARDWAHENVNVPDYLWLGPASLGRFAVEHRFAGQLVEGFAEAGFRVRID